MLPTLQESLTDLQKVKHGVSRNETSNSIPKVIKINAYINLYTNVYTVLFIITKSTNNPNVKKW